MLRGGMTKRERVLAAVCHQQPDVIPQQEGFMDEELSAAFARRYHPRTGDWGRDTLAAADWMDNHFIGAGGGGLRATVIERGADTRVQEYENGMRWRIHSSSQSGQWWREYFGYPVRLRDGAPNWDALERMPLPDPGDPARYANVAERVRFAHDHGYAAQGSINGFYSAMWYFVMPVDDLLLAMAAEPAFVQAALERFATFNLRVAEHLLQAGCEFITWVDDLGHNLAPFISPAAYREFIFPWHERIADLCHRYGAYAHMHSHGNINLLLPQMAEAGIDLINPVGPSDGMDVAQLKEQYGDRMTLVGGISKYLADMSRDQLDQHVEQVVRAGTAGPPGGHILMSEGSIPPMDDARVLFYLERLRHWRRRYGAAGGAP